MELSEIHKDVLGELINIGIGRAAGLLNQMTQAHVSLEVPEIELLTVAEFQTHPLVSETGRLSSVMLAFQGPFSGSAALVFPKDSAVKLVDMLTGAKGRYFDMDSLRVGALQEVGNIVLNGVMGSISNVLDTHISYMPPEYYEETLGAILEQNKESDSVLFIRARFGVRERFIEGDIIIIFRMGSLEQLLKALDSILPTELATGA